MPEPIDSDAANPLREPAPGAIAEDQRSISRVLVVTMAVAVAFAVGNLYFIQPLLGTISRSFLWPKAQSASPRVSLKWGRLSGCCFLLPLGDIFDRRRLIFLALAGSAVALLAVGGFTGCALAARGVFRAGGFHI